MAQKVAIMEARTQLIEEREPTIKMNYDAFIQFERDVVKMMFSERPLTAYEIFYNLVVTAYCFKVVYPSDNKGNKKFEKKLPTDHAEEYIKKNGAEGAAAKLNRDYQAEVPSYKTVQRLCVDFHAVGWFGKRSVGNKKYYYLGKATKEHLKKEFPAEFA
jgi:hypothetical protein